MNERDRHHLTFLASGAEMVSRHARGLSSVPLWKTAAVDELEDAKEALVKALEKIEGAMQQYKSKEIA